MEIIFDENKETTFQGQIYPIFNLETNVSIDFNWLLQTAKTLANRYQDEENIIIVPSQENDCMMIFAALLSIVGRDNTPAPRQAIFKVADFREAMEKYRDFYAFTIAAVYTLRLMKMDVKEMYKDIEALSYLGLETQTDYIKNTLTLHLPSNGKKYVFKAGNMENTIILTSFIKMLSIINAKPQIDVKIILNKLPENNIKDKSEDAMLNKLFWCAKSFLGIK